MFISATLLTATFVVYLYLPDLDHFFGKMLMCYLSGPVISYFLIVLVKLKGISSESSIYETIGYIVFFAFISSFAWVNVISFDLWKSFRWVFALLFGFGFFFYLFKNISTFTQHNRYDGILSTKIATALYALCVWFGTFPNIALLLSWTDQSAIGWRKTRR